MEKDFAKVTNAVYKILDFFPESDPLKYKTKEKVLEILESLTLVTSEHGWFSLKDLLSPEREKIALQIIDDIEVLKNYLTIARGQGWIDALNFLIITNEYNAIKDTLYHSEGVIKKNLEASSVLDEKELVVSQKSSTQNISLERVGVKQTSDSNPIDKVQQGKPQELTKATARQEKILQILQKKEKAQVADLIKELPKITKRTVRRDLGDLLKKGKITRVGEWNQVFYQLSK